MQSRHSCVSGRWSLIGVCTGLTGAHLCTEGMQRRRPLSITWCAMPSSHKTVIHARQMKLLRLQASEAPAFQERLVRNGAKYAAALRQRAALAQVAHGLLLPADAGFCALARKNIVNAMMVRSAVHPFSREASYVWWTWHCPTHLLPGCCQERPVPTAHAVPVCRVGTINCGLTAVGKQTASCML